MNQDIFSGVGNIIKNEVLFRIGVQPESLLGNLPAKKRKELISEARNYSFDFLKWKREFVLKKHWLVHTKSICPVCGQKLIKKQTGVGKRRSFYCEKDQKLY
jgi:endonuclease-8